MMLRPEESNQFTVLLERAPHEWTHIHNLHASLLLRLNPSAHATASGPAPKTVMSSIETTVVSEVPQRVSARAYSRQSAASGPA